MDSSSSDQEPRLDKTRHIKYWKRCLKTLLPHHYTGNESNRMYLAYLTVCALDLLDSWTDITTEQERNEYVDWIYHCQHPSGGFRMWPGTDLRPRANQSNAQWDPANVPATYFALCTLLVMGDDFKRIRRKNTLEWLRKMQRRDGSFGETLVNGKVEGGRDPRFGYCAAGVRYILRGPDHGPVKIGSNEIEDINVDSLVECIRSAESYDGGIAEDAFHEPQAGYTFCALGALRFLNRIKVPDDPPNSSITGPSDPELIIRWLVSRQTDIIDPDDPLDSALDGLAAIHIPEHTTNESNPKSDSESIAPAHQDPNQSIFLPCRQTSVIAGMNGRPNKVADTCYAWWVGASFHILGHPELYNREALQRYLLEATQHSALGGFGKVAGDLPDLHHSYLGLAALGLTSTTDVKAVDGGMCISKEASDRLPALWKSWKG